MQKERTYNKRSGLNAMQNAIQDRCSFFYGGKTVKIFGFVARGRNSYLRLSPVKS